MVSRILTTHVGSLPRPHDLLDMMKARLGGEVYDQGAYDARVRNAVFERTDEEYYHAVGSALREEYKAIVEAGFYLQIDDPFLSGRRASERGGLCPECRTGAGAPRVLKS